MAVAGILTTALHAAANPKNRPEVKTAGLEHLDKSGTEQNRNIYAAFVNVSAATFYASELTWPDLGYPGVSVDHPEILNHPPPIPWRPGDPRPVEP